MLLIRTYEPADQQQVLDLYVRAMEGNYAGPGPWEADLHEIPAHYMGNRGVFLTGWLEGELVATGAFRNIGGELAEVKRMRVAPVQQRRGLGHDIYHALEREARRMGYRGFCLDTGEAMMPAQKFYTAHGFRETGRGMLQAPPVMVVWYEKIFAEHQVEASAAELLEIYTCASAGEPMHCVVQIEAIAGRGLDGDRYMHGRGTWSKKAEWWNEITLIESETLEGLAREHGIVIPSGGYRRNLVTRGIDLNALFGREFSVGGVRLLGIRPCDPCRYLDTKTQPGVKQALGDRGGLRASIVAGGLLRRGDAIVL